MYETDFRLGPVRNIFSSLFANHNMKLITISKQVRRKASEVKIKICFNFLLSFMFNIRNPNCEMFYTKKGNWNQFNFILLRFFVSLYFSEFIAKVHIFRDLSPYRPFQELNMKNKMIANVDRTTFTFTKNLRLQVVSKVPNKASLWWPLLSLASYHLASKLATKASNNK